MMLRIVILFGKGMFVTLSRSTLQITDQAGSSNAPGYEVLTGLNVLSMRQFIDYQMERFPRSGLSL
jgi:hypothetical protein